MKAENELQIEITKRYPTNVSVLIEGMPYSINTDGWEDTSDKSIKDYIIDMQIGQD